VYQKLTAASLPKAKIPVESKNKTTDNNKSPNRPAENPAASIKQHGTTVASSMPCCVQRLKGNGQQHAA
jgi:hypothetical protein